MEAFICVETVSTNSPIVKILFRVIFRGVELKKKRLVEKWF